MAATEVDTMDQVNQSISPSARRYQGKKGRLPDYLRQLLRTNELGLNIMPISELLVQYKKDTNATSEKCYEALKTLSTASMGKSGTSPLYVVECFKAPKAKEVITCDNVNRYYSQIMTGLYSLFAHDVISKITMSDTGNDRKTVSECYCPLCMYVHYACGTVVPHKALLSCGDPS